MEIRIPDIYKKVGSFANNSTIPLDERRFLARQQGESSEQARDLAKFRGEEALFDFYRELGLCPKTQHHDDWMSYKK